MIFAIAHEKGGCGKTVTALNLVNELKPDLVIDLDKLKCLSTLNSLRAENTRFNAVWCKNNTQLIKLLKAHINQRIIIDCGGFDSESTRTAIAAADIVVTPCNGDATELVGLLSFDKVLKEIGQSTGQVLKGHVLINRVEPQTRNFTALIDFVSNAEHLRLLETITPRRKPVAEASASGLAIGEVTSKKAGTLKAQAEFKNLAKELKAIL